MAFLSRPATSFTGHLRRFIRRNYAIKYHKKRKDPEIALNLAKLDKVTFQSYISPTIWLPKPFHDNLYDFLEVFNPRELARDAYIFSKFIRNRSSVDYVADNRDSFRLPKLNKPHSNTLQKLTKSYGLDKIIAEYNKNIIDASEKKTGKKRVALFSYQPRECAAYAASRTQGVYGATFRVLNELRLRDPAFKPETVLDYGSGIGCSVWAAHSLWGDSIKKYECIEISDCMIDLSIRLNRQPNHDQDFIPNVVHNYKIPGDRQFDLVIAAYTLTEFPYNAMRLLALKELLKISTKYLVIIDTGNIDGFNSILNARKLVESNPEKDELSILAPCPQDVFCPRSVRYGSKYRPCIFPQNVQLAFYEGHRRRYNFSCEKFSYIILLKSSKTAESELPRLVENVDKFKGHITCEMCTKDCQIVRHNFSKGKDPDVYKSLRKHVGCGDSLPLPDRQYLGYKRVVLPTDPNDDTKIRRKLENIKKKITDIMMIEELPKSRNTDIVLEGD